MALSPNIRFSYPDVRLHYRFRRCLCPSRVSVSRPTGRRTFRAAIARGRHQATCAGCRRLCASATSLNCRGACPSRAASAICLPYHPAPGTKALRLRICPVCARCQGLVPASVTDPSATAFTGSPGMVSSEKGIDMPANSSCFRYQPDLPPALRQMHTGTTCFRYQPDVPPAPPGVRQMPTTCCFRYPSISPGVRQMPTSGTCFSYPDDAPWSTPGQDAVPALRRMPVGTCFRY